METADTATSGAGAPPPDAAATSGTTNADAQAASATPAPSEVAASTDSGAPAAPLTEADLDARFDAAMREEAESGEGDPAEEEADPSADEKKPADPEPEQPEADADEADADPLAEFEQTIPTRDEIEKKYPRAPKAIREEFAETAEKLAAREETISKLGGDDGLQVAEAIMPHVIAAQVTPEGVSAVMDALAEANTPLLAGMAQEFVSVALDDPKTGAQFADRLFTEEFGEGYNVEKVRRMVEADKEGLIDWESIGEGQEFARQPTARETELETKLRQAEAQVKQLQGDGQDATRKQAENLQQTARDAISKVVMSKVEPIAAKVGWQGDGMLARLGALATAELNLGVEQTPEWNAVMALVEEGQAFSAGQPTRRMRVAMDAIGRRSEAMFLRTVRDLRPVLDMLAGKNKPAATKPPADKSRSGEQPAPPPRAPEAKKRPLSADELQAELDRKFDATMRDARTG